MDAGHAKKHCPLEGPTFFPFGIGAKQYDLPFFVLEAFKCCLLVWECSPFFLGPYLLGQFLQVSRFPQK